MAAMVPVAPLLEKLSKFGYSAVDAEEIVRAELGALAAKLGESRVFPGVSPPAGQYDVAGLSVPEPVAQVLAGRLAALDGRAGRDALDEVEKLTGSRGRLAARLDDTDRKWRSGIARAIHAGVNPADVAAAANISEDVARYIADQRPDGV